jgi:hypothetical protein
LISRKVATSGNGQKFQDLISKMNEPNSKIEHQIHAPNSRHLSATTTFCEKTEKTAK